MNARLSIAALATVLGTVGFLASCSSDSGGGGGDTTGSSGSSGGADTAAARAFFVSKVYPSIEPTCSKCHATGERGAPVFLASGGDASYTALEGATGLIADPSSSPLIQHGLHSGPALTSDQGDLVTEWLKMEVTARKLSGDTGKPANLRAAFKAFGACMDYTEWKSLGLNNIAGTDTINSGQCQSCHIKGQASLWLNCGNDPKNCGAQESDETFLKFTQFPYIQRLVVGSVNPSGAFDSLQNSRRMMDKGTEAQQVNANSHPRFALSPTVMANITQFVSDTLSNMNAGRCQGVTQPDGGAD
jgi:hypothetical protein